MIWYNMFQTSVRAERIYTNNSGTHYTIILGFKNKCVLSAHACVGKIMLGYAKFFRLVRAF